MNFQDLFLKIKQLEKIELIAYLLIVFGGLLVIISLILLLL